MDYITVVDRLPCLDEKMFVDNLLIQGGGPSATAMVAAARLGARTGIVAPIASDAIGKAIVAELEGEGVDTSAAPIFPEGRSAFAFVMITREGGLRTIVGRRPELPFLDESQVPVEEVRRAKVLFVDGNEPAAQLYAAKEAAAAGVPVIMDAGNEKRGMRELVPWTDVLIASRTFGRTVGGSEEPAAAARSLLGMGVRRVAAVTAGAQGAWFVTADEEFHQPAFAVETVDTTGAGDAFHGAYAYAMAHGWAARRSARFAAAVAGMKCRKVGGRTGLPTLGEVEDFLGWA
jgi:ribokinase